jgi:hypothetical protein
MMEAPFSILADRTQIKIGWKAPTDDGFSTVVGYRLYWNGGGSSNLIDTPLYDTASDSIFSYTLTTPQITTGSQYSFAVAAYNSVSTSAKSNIIQVIAALVPGQPSSVTRTSSAKTAVTFSWIAPDDGGSPITSYIV